MYLELCQKRQLRAPSFFRYQQKKTGLALRNLLSKNIWFLAKRRFEIDDRSVPGELTFKRPLIGAKYDHY